MRKELKEAFQEKLGDEARNRMFHAADQFLTEKARPNETFWAKLFGPAGGFALSAGMAAAVGIYVLLLNTPADVQAPPHAGLDPDLVRNIDLLLDFETLEIWEPKT